MSERENERERGHKHDDEDNNKSLINDNNTDLDQELIMSDDDDDDSDTIFRGDGFGNLEFLLLMGADFVAKQAMVLVLGRIGTISPY